MIINRNLAASINDFIEKPHENNVLLLGGARQVGKSTLVKEVLKNKPNVFINLFEDPSLSEKIDVLQSFVEFEKLLLREMNFRPTGDVVLVFDEAQESKKFGHWIRFFKEKWPHQKVVVLGSILSNLFEDGQPYPVGRVEEMILRPFSFKEFLLATNRQALREILESVSWEVPLSENDREACIKPYLEYLQVGGMPTVVNQFRDLTTPPYTTWNQLLGQYAADVERYLDDNFRSLFLSAIDRLADVTCTPSKISQIVSTDSPFYRRLPKLLEVLEKWHLAAKTTAQTKQPEAAAGIASKRYLFDVGLVNFLLNQSQPVKWQKRSDAGNTFYGKLQETFVCAEYLATHPTPPVTFNYYRDSRNSQEVDFIFTLNGQNVPVEVKSQSTINRNGLVPSVNYLEHRGLSTGVLIYNGPMTRLKMKGKTILALPPFLVSEMGRLV